MEFNDLVKNYQGLLSSAGNTLSQLGSGVSQLMGPKTYTSWNRPAMAQQAPVQNVAPVQQPIQQPTQTQAPTGRVMTRDEVRPLVQKYWNGVDPEMVLNVIQGESGFDPRAGHINEPLWKKVEGGIQSRDQWLGLRKQYPSIDIGLMQINTAKAVSDYLASKGLTYYDMTENPELALQIGHDLFSGKIPYTAPGWGNWVAAKNLGYK